mmetsp:Transcript_10513/g.21165  ORF Transcript_10513/g.21165 Transcript_10513/m.21165 type:complete len:297 (-) Transcript_10513:189-1079(-)
MILEDFVGDDSGFGTFSFGLGDIIPDFGSDPGGFPRTSVLKLEHSETPDVADETSLLIRSPPPMPTIPHPSTAVDFMLRMENCSGEYSPHSDCGVSGSIVSLPSPEKKEIREPDGGVEGRIEKPKKSESSKKAPKVKKPSKYCHLCGHTASVDHRVLCRNIAAGSCRKTICRSCFMNQGWSFDECARNPNWECSHCRNECPQRAQCTYYARTNKKRHVNLMLRKAVQRQGLLGQSATFDESVGPVSTDVEGEPQLIQESMNLIPRDVSDILQGPDISTSELTSADAWFYPSTTIEF